MSTLEIVERITLFCTGIALGIISGINEIEAYCPMWFFIGIISIGFIAALVAFNDGHCGKRKIAFLKFVTCGYVPYAIMPLFFM
jgi:hypothetical protein